MEFSYGLEDRLDIKTMAIIYSCSAFGFLLIVTAIIIVIARLCVNSAMKKNQETW